MDWTHDGIVLSARKHGETSAIVTLLTRQKGRHAGLVRGGAGRRQRGVLQPGNLVHAHWRARLPEHLGTLTCELAHAHAAEILHDAPRLAALSAACAVTDAALPEREAHPAVFDGLAALLDALVGGSWPSVYVKWELGMLGELGFGLDLSRCAATGSNDDLVYVSPKTGRAVSASAGEPYKDVLLPLPPFLLDEGMEGGAAEISDGLGLTGYFLERHVFAAHGKALPAARRRLTDRLGADAGPRPGP
ncbi:MAG: DNA repair protein RecO [Rhodospirillales bacterium]|jgi:DNA repair protein RecO (recombination protein O)|nr:DNA repair protein RecO [Rhodospirillales bacterium]MDP6773818.1 DNA repair protein RecO [Rhodospirillales bacterium]